jgi:hypothetical protein
MAKASNTSVITFEHACANVETLALADGKQRGALINAVRDALKIKGDQDSIDALRKFFIRGRIRGELGLTVEGFDKEYAKPLKAREPQFRKVLASALSQYSQALVNLGLVTPRSGAGGPKADKPKASQTTQTARPPITVESFVIPDVKDTVEALKVVGGFDKALWNLVNGHGKALTGDAGNHILAAIKAFHKAFGEASQMLTKPDTREAEIARLKAQIAALETA